MPSEIFELAAMSGAIVLGYWIALWLISLIIRDSSIGDPLYPLSMLLVAGFFYFWCDGFQPRQDLVLTTALAPTSTKS